MPAVMNMNAFPPRKSYKPEGKFVCKVHCRIRHSIYLDVGSLRTPDAITELSGMYIAFCFDAQMVVISF
jgi:hypothetical protein